MHGGEKFHKEEYITRKITTKKWDDTTLRKTYHFTIPILDPG